MHKIINFSRNKENYRKRIPYPLFSLSLSTEQAKKNTTSLPPPLLFPPLATHESLFLLPRKCHLHERRKNFRDILHLLLLLSPPHSTRQPTDRKPAHRLFSIAIDPGEGREEGGGEEKTTKNGKEKCFFSGRFSFTPPNYRIRILQRNLPLSLLPPPSSPLSSVKI